MNLDPSTLAWLIPLAGLLLGVLAGEASGGHRFCAYGALADLAARRPALRARSWGLAVVVAALGTATLSAFGWIDPGKTLYAPSRLNWLGHLLGGAAFGVGMVLAKGCSMRSITRAGSGSLPALVALVFLAVAASMTLRGLFAPLRIEAFEPLTIALPAQGTLPHLLGSWLAVPPPVAGLVIALGLAVGWLTLAVRRPIDWRAGELRRGLAIGLLIVAGWWLTGHLGHLAEHPETLEEAFVRTNSNRMESLSLAAPLAYGLELLLLWTDQSRVLTFGIATAAGIALGAWNHARRHGELSDREALQRHDLLRHMLGGTLMGFGAVLATGCTVGQGLSGLAVLSPGAALASAGIVGGAWWALRRQKEIATCGD